MEIRAVRFEAFKSLYDVSCDLDHLSVITGPNGSGKSNFVDGLNFIGEVYVHGLEYAVSRAGGYENIAHRRSRRAKREMSFTVEVAVSDADLSEASNLFSPGPEPASPNNTAGLLFRHSFSFKTAGQSVRADFLVSSDVVELVDSYRRPVFRLWREGGRMGTWVTPARSQLGKLVRDMVEPFGDKRYSDFFTTRPLNPTSLVTEQLTFANLLWVLKRKLSGISIFQLSPFQCRNPGVPTPNATLERHGENLPGAADYLRRNNPEAWLQVQRAMRSILPDLIEIDVAYTEDRRLALQFKERGLGRPWNTGEVSDGTIQALALFIALYDRRNPMLVIEEPENSIHPWILRQFLDLCTELKGKQILLTTHSPVLLNYVPPSIVRLMFIDKGRSQIRSLMGMSEEVRHLVASGDLSLFDAYDSGMLPVTVPRGFSPEVDNYEGREYEGDEELLDP